MSQAFRVWAPRARQVDLAVDDRKVPMRQGDATGWWVCDEERLEGMRYGFSLEEGPVLPDPRSESQPDGVHGRSEVVDHSSFNWSDQDWRGVNLEDTVLYEMHVGTFTTAGTFEGAIDRLDPLVELGVDAIELMPVAEFPGARGWGYDGVDLYAPHHSYGGTAGLKRLVDACHRHGLGVVLDVVYNHLGPDGNYLARFGPYFSDQSQTNWGPAVNFDGEGNHEVRRYVLDNAEMWFSEYHIDGLRLDAVHAIADDSETHVLDELATETAKLAGAVGRRLVLVAESDENDPRYVRDRSGGGMGLDGVWADEWHHALHAVLAGETDGYYEDFGSLDDLATALRQAWVYAGKYSPHRGRVHGESPAGIRADRFVVFTQNHDQVGNRAVGERSSELMSVGRLKVAAALLLMGQFTPMIFQGEEWGASAPFLYFTDHQDHDLAASVSSGRRREFAHFGWDPESIPDPQSEESFVASRLDWGERSKSPHRELLAWYQRLIALRRARVNAASRSNETVDVVVDGAAGTIDFSRNGLRVLANVGTNTTGFDVGPDSEVLVASYPDAAVVADRVGVPADAVAIVAV